MNDKPELVLAKDRKIQTPHVASNKQYIKKLLTDQPSNRKIFNQLIEKYRKA